MLEYDLEFTEVSGDTIESCIEAWQPKTITVHTPFTCYYMPSETSYWQGHLDLTYNAGMSTEQNLER